MAIAQKQIDYAIEIDALMGLIVLIVSDVKSNKSPSEVMVDALPKLISVLSGIGQLSEELKANKKAVEATVGYKLGELVSILTA